MSAIETLRDALFGNPPSPTIKPSREGVLAAFSTIADSLLASGFASGIYETTTAGLAATTNGKLFLVAGSGPDFARLYKNSAGVAVDQGISLPSSAAIALKASLAELLAETERAQDAEAVLDDRLTDVEGVLPQKANTADLADVATSGQYGDLEGKPALGSAAAMDASAFSPAAQGNQNAAGLAAEIEARALLATRVATTEGDVTQLDAGLAAEISARTELATRVADTEADIATASADIAAVSANLATEVQERTDQVAGLEQADTLLAERIDDESSAREALDVRLGDETAAREAADATFSAFKENAEHNITDLNEGLQAESSERQAADAVFATFQENAEQNITDLNEGLSTEVDERTAGDEAIKDGLVVKTGPSLGRVPGTKRKASAAISGSDGRIKSITADDGRAFTAGAGGDFSAPANIRTGPSMGRVPGSRSKIRGVLQAADGRSVGYQTNEGPYEPTPGGVWARQGQGIRGPSLGRLPGSKERAALAEIDPVSRQLVRVTGGGDGTGTASQLLATPKGLVPVGGEPSDPVTFDAQSTTIPVQAGSVTMPGYDRSVSWNEATVTSPAIAPVAIADEVVAAGVNAETWLVYELILSVTAVRRVSDNAPMIEGVNWSLAYDRGIFRNLTGQAMEIDYIAAPQRKSRISVETRGKVGPAVPTITLGPVKPRNAHLYLPALPAGHVEIALELHKGTHGILIPRWRWRDRVHLARLAEYQAQRSYNRRILAPVISALQSGRRVCVVGHGNSRVAHGAGGDMTKLNTRPNSHKSSDPTNDWIRDYALGYYASYSAADMAAAGFGAYEVFNETPGFNLTGGTPDGHGALHIKAGAVWNMLKELHRAYPKAEIAYLNFGVPGTTSGTGAGGAGNMNALNPMRWDAVQQAMQDEKDAHPDGAILYIPIDPMNELGSTQSYTNWRELVGGAQAIGAIPHFMGLSRPDTRFSATAAADADFSAAEMCRAAYDSGSAFSDGLRMLSPENLASIGLCEDEIAQATLQNHDGVTVEIANGLDAAAPYF